MVLFIYFFITLTGFFWLSGMEETAVLGSSSGGVVEHSMKLPLFVPCTSQDCIERGDTLVAFWEGFYREGVVQDVDTINGIDRYGRPKKMVFVTLEFMVPELSSEPIIAKHFNIKYFFKKNLTKVSKDQNI